MSAKSNESKNVLPKDGDKDKGKESKKSVAPLEEDDEFEDFPVEGRRIYCAILTFRLG